MRSQHNVAIRMLELGVSVCRSLTCLRGIHKNLKGEGKVYDRSCIVVDKMHELHVSVPTWACCWRPTADEQLSSEMVEASAREVGQGSLSISSATAMAAAAVGDGLWGVDSSLFWSYVTSGSCFGLNSTLQVQFQCGKIWHLDPLEVDA